MSTNKTLEQKYKPWVITVSIVIPVVVAFLFTVSIDGVDLSFLPPIYASLNGLTAILLVAAVIAIKKGNRKVHQKLVTTAVVCSVLFLVGYVAYHITAESVKFGDVNHDGVTDDAEKANVGSARYVYFFMLASHILLSMIVLPLVLMTYLKGWADNVKSHRKWAKVTFPIWLYVAISGVVVYLMISPYYA